MWVKNMWMDVDTKIIDAIKKFMHLSDKLIEDEARKAIEKQNLFAQTSTSITFQSELEAEITKWLVNNRNLTDAERTEKVRSMIENLDKSALIEHSIRASINFDEMLKIFDISQNALNVNLCLHQATYKHFQSVRNKKAKQVQVDKNQAVWNELQSYWQTKLTHINSATQAAIELEKTGMYKNSEFKPAREVIAKKVREWKKSS
jgi:hypothetical protein